jgi:hypothetical protein
MTTRSPLRWEHFHGREAERRAQQVQKWKDEDDYPYPGEPGTEAERAERETFDYVATTVARKIPKSQIGRRRLAPLLTLTSMTGPAPSGFLANSGPSSAHLAAPPMRFVALDEVRPPRSFAWTYG